MSLSKKKRFEVFKRDGFVCQYCGNTPPKVVLEVDHINPKSKGGSDDIDNLITACFDCNRGKSNIELDAIPETLEQKYKAIKEKELQLTEYNRLLSEIDEKLYSDAVDVDNVFSSYFEDFSLKERFLRGSLKKFLQLLPKSIVIDSMHSACSKMSFHEDAIRYFCGICWNRIREN